MIYLYQRCSQRGGGGEARAPRNLADQLTLFKLHTTTLLRIQRATYTSVYFVLLSLKCHGMKFHGKSFQENAGNFVPTVTRGQFVYYWGVGVSNCVIVFGEGGTPSHWSAHLCAFDLEISRAMYSGWCIFCDGGDFPRIV